MAIKDSETRAFSVRDRLNIIRRLYIRLRIFSIERRLATR